MPDISRQIAFYHDGHRFDATERVGTRPDREATQVHWVVHMDSGPALEFRGPYPYRDQDVRQRVLEWYAIQGAGRTE